jgi:hypothetical protein
MPTVDEDQLYQQRCLALDIRKSVGLVTPRATQTYENLQRTFEYDGLAYVSILGDYRVQ